MVKPTDQMDLGPGHKGVPKRKCIFYYFLFQNIHKIQETANDRKQINRMYFYYFVQTTAKRRTEVPKKSAVNQPWYTLKKKNVVNF